jgi:hypothetical protein
VHRLPVGRRKLASFSERWPFRKIIDVLSGLDGEIHQLQTKKSWVKRTSVLAHRPLFLFERNEQA